MRTKLPVTVWGHAILHAAALIRLRPSADHKHTPYQLVTGKEPNISHLRIFSCAVYVPIAPPQRTRMRPQRRLGIYVGYESPSIIRHLEPLTSDVFLARFADCHFDETKFPTLGGENKPMENEITWHVSHLLHLDPYNKSWEENVKKIVHLQDLANQLPDSSTDLKKVTKSHVPAVNVPARIEISKLNDVASTSKARLKRGRPMSSKDKNLRKRKGTKKVNIIESDLEKILDNDKSENEKCALEKAQDDVNEIIDNETENKNDLEISINYVNTGNLWSRKDKILMKYFHSPLHVKLQMKMMIPNLELLMNVKIDMIRKIGKLQ